MHTHPRRPHGGASAVMRGRTARMYALVARTVMRGRYRKIAIDAAAAAPRDGVVLDVGTGPGILLVELARLRPDLRLTGIDPSTDMITAAKRNLDGFGDRARAVTGDAADLPVPAASVDLVISSLSSHHWGDPAAAVVELARVLRPGGRLYLYDFPSAPFDTIVDTAREKSLFTGEPPQRTPFRAGLLFRLDRLVLAAARG